MKKLIMKSKRKILVLGIGNELLRDDGIGPKVVKKLQNFLPHEDVDYQTAIVGGMETIERMRGYTETMIIDAVMTEEGQPGTVYYMNFPTNMDTLHLSNAHDISFEMSVKLAHRLNIPIPWKISIIGIEIAEDRVFGDTLSPRLQEKYADIFSSVADIVRDNLC